jgi:TonB family protein
MTDRMEMMRNHSRNSRGKYLAVFGSCMAFVPWSGAILADDESSPSVIHFVDSSTDRNPVLTTFPQYPSVARRDRIQGEATVCFKIRANGKISRAVVTERTHRIFAKPSLRAMRKSTYEPLNSSQVLSPARTCRTYRFRLDPVLANNDSAGQD